MSAYKYFLAIVLMIAGTPAVNENLPKPFVTLLDRAQMTFQKPHGFEEMKIVSNKQMSYEYAMEWPNKNFEVRIAIRALDERMKDYNTKEKKKKPGDVNEDPNTLYEASFQTIIMNISGGKLSDITTFRKDEVKAEFNADWGATTLVEVGKEFGQNYKYCIVVALHKDNLADAYYFYLADTKEAYTYLMQPAYYALRFK